MISADIHDLINSTKNNINSNENLLLCIAFIFILLLFFIIKIKSLLFQYLLLIPINCVLVNQYSILLSSFIFMIYNYKYYNNNYRYIIFLNIVFAVLFFINENILKEKQSSAEKSLIGTFCLNVFIFAFNLYFIFLLKNVNNNDNSTDKKNNSFLTEKNYLDDSSKNTVISNINTNEQFNFQYQR